MITRERNRQFADRSRVAARLSLFDRSIDCSSRCAGIGHGDSRIRGQARSPDQPRLPVRLPLRRLRLRRGDGDAGPPGQPVWGSATPDYAQASGRASKVGLALFLLSTVWFVLHALIEFRFLIGDTRRRAGSISATLIVYLFPPVIMHTVYLETQSDPDPPPPPIYRWRWR